MTLYYTRNLRPNNATTIPVGQMVLEIPPQQPSVEITGTCPSSCTSRLFAQPFYVIKAVNHMHYLGNYLLRCCFEPSHPQKIMSGLKTNFG